MELYKVGLCWRKWPPVYVLWRAPPNTDSSLFIFCLLEQLGWTTLFYHTLNHKSGTMQKMNRNYWLYIINLSAYTLLVLSVYNDKIPFTCKARTNLSPFILPVLNGLYVIFMVLVAFLSLVQVFKRWRSGLLTLWVSKLLINCGKMMYIKDLKPSYGMDFDDTQDNIIKI